MPPTPRRPRSLSRLEFQSPADGAWYDARVAMQRGALRVMYEEFPEEQDEWYDPAALASSASAARDVAALRARFRAASPPLEDARCRDLRAGAPLCVSCPLDGGLLKFFDAVLESVRPSLILTHPDGGACCLVFEAAANAGRTDVQAVPGAHGIVDGEERCACRFTVRWTGGAARLEQGGGRRRAGLLRAALAGAGPGAQRVPGRRDQAARRWHQRECDGV